MELADRAVIVIELPAAIDLKQARTFVRQLANRIGRVARPCVVLDCGGVRRIDSAFLHLLVCSLEEAMRRNGDVRLCGLPQAAWPALKSFGVERLFRLYSTAAQAAESFRRPSATETTFTRSQGSTTQLPAQAA